MYLYIAFCGPKYRIVKCTRCLVDFSGNVWASWCKAVLQVSSRGSYCTSELHICKVLKFSRRHCQVLKLLSNERLKVWKYWRVWDTWLTDKTIIWESALYATRCFHRFGCFLPLSNNLLQLYLFIFHILYPSCRFILISVTQITQWCRLDLLLRNLLVSLWSVFWNHQCRVSSEESSAWSFFSSRVMRFVRIYSTFNRYFQAKCRSFLT